MIHLKPRSLFPSFLSTLLFVLAAAPSTVAQEYPELFGTGPVSAGTEFYVIFPANWEITSAAEKYVRLYISSVVETTVDIHASGEFLGSLTTVPNDVVTFDLSNIAAQAFVRTDLSPIPADQVYEGRAVRIVADDPVVVYGLNRTSLTSDGMLILPVNALGRDYIVASAASVAGGAQNLPSQYMVIAPYDSTIVTITNPMNTPNHAAGETFEIILNRGDVYSAMSADGGGDLTGARITADKPVAVTAGQNCTYLPTFEFPACDHLEEMLLPVESWGMHYHSIPYMNRTKGDTYRIITGEDNAGIYVNGVLLATLSNAGGGEGIGWVEYRPLDRRPLEFSSDKRISVAQYNNSQTYDNAAGSDPFYIVLTPMEQYQEELVFSTAGDDFPQNFINIVGDSAAVADAEILEAGQTVWQNLSTFIGVDYAFPTAINGVKYAGRSITIDPGVYRLRSSGPVAGYIYAGSPYDSYGYPLSVATASVPSGPADADQAAPVVNKAADCDGSATGTVRDVNEDGADPAGLSTMRLHPNSINYLLEVDPFVVGGSAAEFRLTVRQPGQEATAIVIVADMAGNYRFDTLQYVPAAAPDVLGSPDFGTVLPDAWKEIQVTLRNDGADPIEIPGLQLARGTEGFGVADPIGSFTIQPGAERTVTLRFGGRQEGTYRDSLLFDNQCGTVYLAALHAKVSTVMGTDDHDDGKEGKKERIEFSILSNPAADGRVTFEYALPSRASATLELFSAEGRMVRTIPLAETAPGMHREHPDLSGLPSGTYLCVLRSGGESASGTLVLLR